jgi:ABC-type nitrate/sulfonate/bicarbonate transport system permease component
LFKIKIPEAIPDIIRGARIGISFALIGVIVGEIAQPSSGLGYLIQQCKDNFQTTLQFAAVFSVSLVGLCLYLIIKMFEQTEYLRKFNVH